MTEAKKREILEDNDAFEYMPGFDSFFDSIDEGNESDNLSLNMWSSADRSQRVDREN